LSPFEGKAYAFLPSRPHHLAVAVVKFIEGRPDQGNDSEANFSSILSNIGILCHIFMQNAIFGVFLGSVCHLFTSALDKADIGWALGMAQ
jgi:hypothetical protein